MTSRSTARYTLAAIRLFNGGAALSTPEQLARRLGDDPQTDGAVIYVLRMFGIRTLVIGTELLVLRRHPRLARRRGAENPTRLVASAKSWLSYGGANRTAAILPWGAPAEVPHISPVEFVHDDENNLYWVSSKTATHSENIRKRPAPSSRGPGAAPAGRPGSGPGR